MERIKRGERRRERDEEGMRERERDRWGIELGDERRGNTEKEREIEREGGVKQMGQNFILH